MSRLKNLASLLTRPKPPVGTTPADVVHRENKWRLLRYRAPANAPRKFETPILLVPSLINRHYVMDLLPGKSMAEDLVKMGHDVYCIDWGTPADEDRFVSFDDVCDTYLGRAIRKVAKASPRGKTHVLGYCLGGTLAAIHAAARPEYIASLLLLVAPVAFAHAGPMAIWTRSPQFQVGAIVEGFGNVPWQLMQGAFHMLRPTLTLAKAVGVIDRAANDEFLDGFLAIETWGNDNVSFPGACYQEYIERLYRGDALINDTMTLSADAGAAREHQDARLLHRVRARQHRPAGQRGGAPRSRRRAKTRSCSEAARQATSARSCRRRRRRTCGRR